MAEAVEFERLVACYYEPLYQFAFSLARDEADACDLTQQTFCIWAAKGHQLRDASKVKTWLFTTLHREFLGTRRRQTRFPHVELEQAEAELPVVPPVNANRFDASQALEALAGLDEIFQAPVALFYLQDCSYNEIAEILDVPLGTVKSRLTRGLGRLQQMLTANVPGAQPKATAIVNPNEAKVILLLYRPGTADADDPQIAEAVALAQRDPELADWLKVHCARQEALRAQFRQITAPAGLKEQIISEQTAREKIIIWRRNTIFAVAAVVVALAALAPFWFPQRPKDDTFAIYRNRMAGVALRGYSMDLVTNSPAQTRAFLAVNSAPADYVLPAPLQKIAVTGCAIQNWQGAKVSMICFRTGRPLTSGQPSDLWLFVVDRATVKDAPTGARQFARVNQLTTVTWSQGDRLYVLGMEGDEQTLRQYL